jgi:hypothetical protein
MEMEMEWFNGSFRVAAKIRRSVIMFQMRIVLIEQSR